MRGSSSWNAGRGTLLIATLWLGLGVLGSPVWGQGVDAETPVSELLRLREPDTAAAWRFVAVVCGGICLAIGIWFAHRRLTGPRPIEGTPVTASTDATDRPAPVKASVSGASDGSSAIEYHEYLEANLEVELFGVGSLEGFCTRGILAHIDEEHLVLRLAEPEEPLPWNKGDEVRVYFWRPSDAGYLFHAHVLDLRVLGMGYLVLSQPEKIERQQRRLFVRVDYKQPVRFLHIPAGDASSSIGLEVGSGGLGVGMVEDLSAGGFRMRCEGTLGLRDYVSIGEFPPVPGEEILARVVSEKETTEDGQNRYGLQFAGIPSSIRDRLTEFVFKVQRESVLERAETGAVIASPPPRPPEASDPI